jgi:hypothetical protein
MEVKAFQAVDTRDNMCLLQAPNAIFFQLAADCLFKLLLGCETKMIEENNSE